MNIERMIQVVCRLIKQQYGFDIQHASEITDKEIQEEILRRVFKGEDIQDVVADCKQKYVRDELPFEKKKTRK